MLNWVFFFLIPSSLSLSLPASLPPSSTVSMSKKENGTKLSIMKPGDRPEARRAPRSSRRRSGTFPALPARRLASSLAHLPWPRTFFSSRGRRKLTAEEEEEEEASSSYLFRDAAGKYLRWRERQQRQRPKPLFFSWTFFSELKQLNYLQQKTTVSYLSG